MFHRLQPYRCTSLAADLLFSSLRRPLARHPPLDPPRVSLRKPTSSRLPSGSRGEGGAVGSCQEGSRHEAEEGFHQQEAAAMPWIGFDLDLEEEEEDDDDTEDPETEDGWLLRSFTVASHCVASAWERALKAIRSSIIYVQNRRSWAAKTILTIMDIVILRVVLGIGVEFCTSKGRESLVEVFFIAWSIFLVTCKFMYLKTVFFMHQISTFSDSRSDLALSAALDIISAITHILMLVAVIAWSAQPEFQTYYDGGTCQTFMKLVISDPETCTRAAREVFGLSFDQPMYGGNRTGFPLTTQPPGCYMSEDLESGAQSLYLNPVLCRLDAAACSWMTSRMYGECGGEGGVCICTCGSASISFTLTVVIFFLPMPIQWKILAWSLSSLWRSIRSGGGLWQWLRGDAGAGRGGGAGASAREAGVELGGGGGERGMGGYSPGLTR